MNLSGVVGWVKNKAHKVANSRLVRNRWLRSGVQALVIMMCLVYLAANWRNLRDVQLEFRWGYLLIALLFGAAAVFLGALGWWFSLRGFGQSLDWFTASKIHIYANLAKYLPGYAWQLLGKGYLTRNAGIPQRVIALSMMFELTQLYLAGLWIAAVTLPDNLVEHWFGENPGWYLSQVPRLIITLLMVGLPFVVAKLAQIKRDWLQGYMVDRKYLVAANIAILLGWLVLGLSYWMVGAGLQTFSLQQIGIFTFTLAVSFLIGLAIIIVPGSIGIRESIMVFVLGPILGSTLAVLIATLSRLILVLSELFSALIIWILEQIRH